MTAPYAISKGTHMSTSTPTDDDETALAAALGDGSAARDVALAIAARIKAAGGDATVITAADKDAAARAGLPTTAFTTPSRESSRLVAACWLVSSKLMSHPGLHGGPTRYLCVSDEGRVIAGQLAISARQLDAMIASHGQIPEGYELDDGWPALARAAASCLRVGDWMDDPPTAADLASLVTCWAQHWPQVSSPWDLARRWLAGRKPQETPRAECSPGQQLTLGFPSCDGPGDVAGGRPRP